MIMHDSWVTGSQIETDNILCINLSHESKAREIVHEIHKNLKDKIISDLSNARSIHIIVDESLDARRQLMIHIMVRYIIYTI